MATYKHLSFERENLNNPRRTKNPPKFTKRDDLRGHGQKLNGYFATAAGAARRQHKSAENSPFVFKLQYDGAMTFENLQKHGLEFISQEGRQVCVVFATEAGLAMFQDHLNKLGVLGQSVSYKQILEAIEGIDAWSAEDRKSWALRHIGLPGTDTFKLDVELWPHHVANHPTRIRLCAAFEKWLAEAGITTIHKLNYDSLVMYRVEVSEAQAQMLLDHSDVRLVDLIPQTGISYPQLNRDIAELPGNIPMPAQDAARICILDSGINTNHPLLKSAIAESQSFVADQDAFDEAGHGTAVAGIALYGDVEACDRSNFWRPEFWLYNGKVMRRCPVTSNAVYDEHTVEATLTEAVEHFVGLGCRVFNLSLGNSNAPYDGTHIRGLAYILDVLARKHNVLFVVSTGNFVGSEEPTVPLNSWREEYPEYLLHERSVIIDPAPALNVLTVGSVARHDATYDSQRYPEIHQLTPASENQPSPFTRHGPSVKGALKPELVAPGGNLACPMHLPNNQWKADMRGLGVLTMNHQFQGSTLFKEISGTSFSAPYITHLAGRLLNEYPDASANLLRAMLVNHASLSSDVETTFPDEMRKAYKANKATYNREISRDVGGYGQVSESDLFRSSDHCVVLMCEEAIEKDTCQFYELPLPVSYLRKTRGLRELSITLAYSPAVRTTRLDYLATQISYRLVKGNSLDEVQTFFNKDKQDEADTRNDDAAPNRDISAQLRSRGTVQSSKWTFKQRNPAEKWYVVVIRQDREWNHPDVLDKEPYALVVTVADRDNEQAQLYTEIQATLAIQVQAREEARQRAAL
ncbi:Subtilisin-like serine proteases [Pseudomonas sp. LAMO17WK12:I10]|uniref:S8 family peptidase n=1 Tax=unclassified Pseudomonas TaxID=196821 RepID=UPI000BDBBEA9|nr:MULTISPECIES: S8 family peptidase [unclassified Pseudomonas]PXX58257.1 subtilase family protein [Pseudomonas sp. LAMO17WK12:I9]SNY47657.1 Subtilisin-like serine proteases [Pseudomonas sp. LAMO17WK12:I10]